MNKEASLAIIHDVEFIRKFKREQIKLQIQWLMIGVIIN